MVKANSFVMLCKRKILVFTLLCCIAKLALAGLTDTIVNIDEVVLKVSRQKNFSTGISVHRIDPDILQLSQNQSIAEILSLNSLAAINTYGPGGLSSISMRGGSNRHTPVIWNGFNLQSPMNGGLNLSTLPSGFMDQVDIQHGGSATLYGSGAATGIIFLNNVLDFGQGDVHVDLNYSHGSCLSQTGLIGGSYHGEKLALSTKFMLQDIPNDFKYKYFGESRRLEHAAFKQLALMQALAWRINHNTNLRLNLWLEDYFKEIPALSSSYAPSYAEQEDRSARVALNLGHYREHFKIKYRSGLFYDELIYEDKQPSNPESSTYNSSSFVNELDLAIDRWEVHRLNFGINHTYENVESTKYDTHRNRSSIYGNYKILPSNWLKLNLNARWEFVDGKDLPPVFSAGIELIPNSDLAFKANISKNYTIPTFNDLYWPEDSWAMGNPDLKSESGWGYEGGLFHQKKVASFLYSHELTLYGNYIDDWIKWFPEEGGKWKPSNNEKGKSWGVEFKGSTEWKTKKLIIKIYYNYAYTRAVLNDASEALKGFEGVQMPYIPEHKVSDALVLKYQNIQFWLNHNFYSIRWTDPNQYLDHYNLLDLHLKYHLPLNKHSINFMAKVHNLLDTSYEVKKGYAMPLRTFTFGINYHFKHKSENK